LNPRSRVRPQMLGPIERRREMLDYFHEH
jgi:hypothetical protein